MSSQGGPMTLEQVRTWIQTRAWHPESTSLSLAICRADPDASDEDSDEGRAVGEVRISQLESRHHTGWVSYWVAPEARGMGLATSAVVTLCGWVFQHTDVVRLELGHRVNNPASGTVAVRAGFIQEGLERQKLEYGSERFDVAVYSRLRSDPQPRASPLPLVLP